ncbi:MAG: flagellar motor protein MotB [Proteocatella sp.]
MRKKKIRPPQDTGKWLGTYADTITLLMCFFVLLYSISSVDATKWEIVVKSFNPDAKATSQIVTEQAPNDGEFDVSGVGKTEIIDEFDELYYTLKKEVDKQALQADVEITKGDGFTFITFRNNVFFDGDSYVLRQQGKDILDSLARIVKGSSKTIGEIQILGHTSQAKPDEPNNVRFDRFLASNRATEVLAYIQQKNVIEPSKLVASSFGQFRPVSPFDTAENRAKNRRVEIVITKNDAVTRALDEYYEEVYK